jgi:hypothetical protein
MLLELLLTAALSILVIGAGVISMFQVMGIGGGLYPRNQMQQVELARMVMAIRGDFNKAQRAYVWDGRVNAGGNTLSQNTHAVTDISDGLERWPLTIGQTDDAAFFSAWEADDPTIAKTASTASAKYSTILLLGGGQKINAVIYIGAVEETTPAVGVRYTIERYADNGNRLVGDMTFSYWAAGANLTTSNDQSDTSELPRAYRHGTSTGVICLRLPTPYSKALKDVQTGAQARRIKNSADVVGEFWFAPSYLSAP